MSYIYTDLTSELNDMIHNKAGSISNLRKLVNRAVRAVNNELDLRSTKREVGLLTGFYDAVQIVPAPSDLKDDAIIDLVPLRGRVAQDEWFKTTVEEFERRNDYTYFSQRRTAYPFFRGISPEYLFAVDEREQLTRLLVNQAGESRAVVLSDCDSIAGDGTWVASGSAENLEVDSWNFLHGSAALRFDTTASASDALLTINGFTSVDLTDFKDKGVIFASLYIPSGGASAISQVKLKWGKAGAYYEKAVSVAHDGLTFREGWNVLSFDWVTATETGSPDITDVDYLQFTIDWDGTPSALQDFRLDRISASIGALHNILYYSNYYWKSSAGTLLELSTADSDILIANDAEKDLVLYKAAVMAAQVLREVKSDLPFFIKQYADEKKNYQRKHKSERKQLVTTYSETYERENRRPR